MLLCHHHAQLSRIVEALRGHGGFDEAATWENIARGWHVYQGRHRMTSLPQRTLEHLVDLVEDRV